jgi:hypothetical protein
MNFLNYTKWLRFGTKQQVQLHIYHSSVNLLNCNYFATIGLFTALPPYAICTHCIDFFYCVIDCTFDYSLCNSVVVCVALLCFILASSQL